jgi:FtsP/CotA-like multicopper oxidase with cupredoxin domain
MGVNGQWPYVCTFDGIMDAYTFRIPTIEADVGDTIVVTAHNNLGNETTSLHFHGMFQKGSGIYDGVCQFLVRAIILTDVTRLLLLQHVPYSQATLTHTPLLPTLPELIGITRMTKANTQMDFEAK